jgi:hypothetical protein
MLLLLLLLSRLPSVGRHPHVAIANIAPAAWPQPPLLCSVILTG